jgi:DNA-binding CsgD family transcriptional regulator/N-acetylneuraminic acid mutarotase
MAEPGEPLSEREQDIVQLVATGATNRQIARDLDISPNTVKVHLRNIFTKLEISSRTEATVIAIREGWVAVGDGGGEEPDGREAAEQESLPSVGAPFRPSPESLPWFKRISMVTALMLVVVVMALARPRAAAVPAETCGDEFTAECPSEENGLMLEEPESQWVGLAPMPDPRGRFSAVALGNSIYVVGGETAGGVTGSLAIYDVDRDTWREGAPKPTAAANLAAVAHDGLIYALGGRGEDGAPLFVVEVYDPADDRWSTGVALPRPLMAHAAVSAGGEVLALGGSDGGSYTAAAWALAPEDGTWRRLPNLPTPRGFMGAAALDDRVYVVGGYDGRKEYANCDWYNAQTEVWGECPSMMAPRGGVGAAAVAGNLFVVGGGWESFTVFSERYNPRSDRWYTVETPVLLAGGEWLNLGVAGAGTRIIALGGWQGGRYLTIAQAYETLPNRLYLPATTAGGK